MKTKNSKFGLSFAYLATKRFIFYFGGTLTFGCSRQREEGGGGGRV